MEFLKDECAVSQQNNDFATFYIEVFDTKLHDLEPGERGAETRFWKWGQTLKYKVGCGGLKHTLWKAGYLEFDCKR